MHLTSTIGELNIYSGHTPLLATIQYGPLTIVTKEE
ncbi:hypothetical protein, partial [Buchnera aphidicola]|nr:hypothetical protein [Buchnera aphidicola (Stegophylla sp.)]